MKYLLALVLLVVMDAFWMQLLAPKVLGIDYFDIVQNIQVQPSFSLSLSYLVQLSLELWFIHCDL